MWRSGELSLAFLTVDGASAAEHVEVAGLAGFSAAGLRIQPPVHLPASQSVVNRPEQVLRHLFSEEEADPGGKDSGATGEGGTGR